MGKKHHHKHINRRSFLGQASCAAVGYTTLLSTLGSLKTINAATSYNTSLNAFRPASDYKALVCILLSGGNDSFNMLAPKGPEWNVYSNTRSNLAIPEQELITIDQTNVPNRSFGLHPSMPNLAALFNGSTASPKSGTEDANVAFISNIGSLIQPITKTQYYAGNVPTPLGLFSHSDQEMHWQTGIPHERVAQGWAGKIADLLAPNNPAYNDVAMNISLGGTNVWQTGQNTIEYSIDPFNGALGIYGYSGPWDFNAARTVGIDNMVDQVHMDIFKQAYIDPIDQSIRGFKILDEALKNATPITTTFTNHGGDAWGYNQFSKGLEMIANVINVRQTLGVNRQIFFLHLGGWDHHDDILPQQEEMLGVVDTGLAEFNAALKELGVNDCVTTFAMSEFSRTLVSNGDGTDHAWGGNIFVMGGGVNGKKIYGTYPSLALGDTLEVGGGVLIPTTSVDEYFAELALWYGVLGSDLNLLFPNLPNFYSIGSGNPIGFLHL